MAFCGDQEQELPYNDGSTKGNSHKHASFIEHKTLLKNKGHKIVLC